MEDKSNQEKDFDNYVNNCTKNEFLFRLSF